LPKLSKRATAEEIVWGRTGKEARMLDKFRKLLARIKEPGRKLLLFTPKDFEEGALWGFRD